MIQNIIKFILYHPWFNQILQMKMNKKTLFFKEINLILLRNENQLSFYRSSHVNGASPSSTLIEFETSLLVRIRWSGNIFDGSIEILLVSIVKS